MQATLSSPTFSGTPVHAKAKWTKTRTSLTITAKKSRKSKTVLSPRRRMALGVGVAVLGGIIVVACTPSRFDKTAFSCDRLGQA